MGRRGTFPWSLPSRMSYALWRKSVPGGLRARARVFWHHVVRHYEHEVCGDCGRPVGVVWLTESGLWRRVMGDDGGLLCVGCFDEKVRGRGGPIAWVPIRLDGLDDAIRGDMVVPLWGGDLKPASEGSETPQ